jgi:hypothetical protein
VTPRPQRAMEARPVGHHGGGPDPQLVVQARRRVAGGAVADVRPPLAVPGLGHQHPADGPFAQQLHGLADRGAAAALRAHLHHTLVPPGGLDHQPPLANVVAAGLLDVDVLARLAGQDCGRGVPVVGRGDGHGIDCLVVEDFPQVGHRMVGLTLLLRLLRAAAVGVADVGDLYVVGQQRLPERLPLPATTNQPRGQPLVGAHRVQRRAGHRPGGGAGHPQARPLQKGPACRRVHVDLRCVGTWFAPSDRSGSNAVRSATADSVGHPKCPTDGRAKSYPPYDAENRPPTSYRCPIAAVKRPAGIRGRLRSLRFL